MIFIGDTHGNHNYIQKEIKGKKITNTTFIHVGDFGIGFINREREIEQIGVWNNKLKADNNILYVIRGNHDDPHFFNEKDIHDYDRSNIKFLPDYSVIEVEGKKILCVGGAVSIDRVPRRRMNLQEIRYGRDKQYYWPNEKFYLDREKLEGLSGIDIVVTHTSPNFAKPFDTKGNWPYIVKQFLYEDDALEDDLIQERLLLDEMYNILKKNNKIDDWFYGHFHRNDTTLHENTLFHMLGINELYEHKEEYGDDFEKEMNEKYGED